MTHDMKNLPVGKCSIECIDHQEYGSFGVSEDFGDYYVIGAGAHSKVLSKDEALKFWRVRVTATNPSAAATAGNGRAP